MAEIGKAVREWISTVGTVITIATALGVSLSKVAPWVIETIPRLSWLIATLTVPWLALLIGAATFAWGFFRLGRHSGERSALIQSVEPRLVVEKMPILNPPTWEHGDPEDWIIRAIHANDPRLSWPGIVSWIKERRNDVRTREYELALEHVEHEGAIDFIYQHYHGRHTKLFQLTAKGMAYAKSRESTNWE